MNPNTLGGRWGIGISQRDAIDVEVEIVLHEARGDCLVVVRPLSTPVPNFSVTAHTTIGGREYRPSKAPEELARAAVSDLLAQVDEDFKSAAERVLRKNADPYSRLA